MIDPAILRLITAALDEDIGAGDVSSRFFIAPGATAPAVILAKAPGVISGTGIATEVFRQVDPRLEVEVRVPDGEPVAAGDAVMRITGHTRALLTAERTALNFLGHLSGIATLTRLHVDAVAGTGAGILDTRKTTPGWRLLEKAAVAAGGGINHRMGLYDQVMVKDNHLLAGNRLDELQSAITEVRVRFPDMRIELEADTLDQVEDFLAIDGVDVILLDNMRPPDLRRAVGLVRGAVKLEASGGVTLESVRAIAETGVDFISVGALTHSAPALDLSLSFETKPRD